MTATVHTTDERTRSRLCGELRYTQTAPGCLYLTCSEHVAFVATLPREALGPLMRSSDGMLRAVASWRYYGTEQSWRRWEVSAERRA